MWKLTVQTIPKFFVAPSKDERWPAVIMFVIIHSPLLVLDSILDPLIACSLPKIRVHDIQDPVPVKYFQCSLINLSHIGEICLVKIVHSDDILFFKM
jgi:hypothetical protein